MSNEVGVIQPNRITMAKYEFSRYEKLVYYQMILQLQDKMGQPDLWGANVEFSIPVSQIDPDRNYRLIRNAFDSLRRKDFTIDDPKNDYYFNGGLLNWGEIKGGIATISIAQKVLEPIWDTLKGGYTAYSVTVAFSLKSNYSMRFYEYCSRFKDTGHWHITPTKLLELLNLLDVKSYQKYGELKRKVIEVAQKELSELYDKGQSDIKFTYTEKREGKGRGGEVVGLYFTIFWSKKGEKAKEKLPSKSEDYYFLLNFLKNNFTTDQNYREKIINYADSTRFLKQFAEIVEIAEKKDNPPAYFRTAVKNEFPNFKL